MKTQEKIKVLSCLKTMKSNVLKIILKYLNDDIHNIVCEATHNVLYNKKLSSSLRGRLRKKLCSHKTFLRYLSNASRPLSNKRKKVGKHPQIVTVLIKASLPLLMKRPKKKKINKIIST